MAPGAVVTVAVLYADPARGPYVPLVGAENVYGIERDARRYYGPGPVVAHPPCGPWSRLRVLAYRDDPATAPTAVMQVRRCGGVLEHPEGSALWAAMGLPPASCTPPLPWVREWTLRIDQCDFGHPCAKPTWLFFVGVGAADLPPLPRRRRPTAVIDKKRLKSGDRSSSLPWLPQRARHLTPPGLAAWLVAAVRRADAALDPVDTTVTGSGIGRDSGDLG